MADISATNYALIPVAFRGYPNQGPWDSTLTDVSTAAAEVPGVLRQEGANTYMYVQLGTGAINSAGVPVKPTTSLTDNAGYLPPVTCTALGATAAGYFSCVGVTVNTATGVSGARYGWICVRGIATLPLNSNTGGMAFGTPVAPASSSAGFAECAAASAVGRACEPAGATVSTASLIAASGHLVMFDFLRSFR